MLKGLATAVGLRKPGSAQIPYVPSNFTAVPIAAPDYCEAQVGMLCGKHAINNLLQEDKLTAVNSANLIVDSSQGNACASLALALQPRNKHLKINAKALCMINPGYCVGSSFYSDDAIEYVLHNILRFRVVANEAPIMQNADDWAKQMMIDIRQKITSDTPGKADLRDDNFIGLLLNKSNSHWTCLTRGFNGFPDNKEYTYLDSQYPNVAICLSLDEIIPFLKSIDKPLNSNGTKTGGIYSYIAIFTVADSYISKASNNIKLVSRQEKISEFKDKRYVLRLMKAIAYFLPEGTFPADVDPIEHMRSQPEIYSKANMESALKYDYKLKDADLITLQFIDELSDEDLIKRMKKFKNAEKSIAKNRLPSYPGSRSLVLSVSSSTPTPELLVTRPSTPVNNRKLVLRPTMAQMNMSWLASASPPEEVESSKPEVDQNIYKLAMNLYNSWTAKGGRATRRRRQHKRQKSRRNKSRQ